MFYTKSLILISFLVVIAALVAASQSANMSGRVEDTMRRAVPGATVILKNKRTSVERTVTTDAEGRFSFPAPATGEYEIVVSASGFARLTQSVLVTAVETVLTLSPETIKEQVTVTATRTQVSTEDTAEPVSVIGREELDQKQVNTIGDVFRTLPGSATNNEGASGHESEVSKATGC